MTNTVPIPSPNVRAATIGGSSFAVFLLTDLLVRRFQIAPEYAQEIVGVATIAAPMVHRWLATWYKYSDGAAAVRLRYWLGNPLP